MNKQKSEDACASDDNNQPERKVNNYVHGIKRR